MPDVYLDDRSWGSHLPVLLACVAATRGPVLELGMGDYSTPCLHSICCNSRRLVVSLDHDPQWVERFTVFRHRFHVVEFSADFLPDVGQHTKSHMPIEGGPWSVVLIDNSPGERRGIDLERWAPRAEYVVMHDTSGEDIQAAIASVESRLPQDLRKFTYARYSPSTTVWGRTIPEIGG